MQAIENLHCEGIKKGIVHSGDLMYQLINAYQGKIADNGIVLEKHDLNRKEYLLLTMHRAGNVDRRENLAKLVDLIIRLPYRIVFPIHPRTRKNLAKFGLFKKLSRTRTITLCEPVSYLENLSLMAGAKAVLTDSGGVQKESVFLGTPCLTLRDETEWVETLKWGNHLVGLSPKKVLDILNRPQRHRKKIDHKIRGQNPSKSIVFAISEFLKGN
jgi:UDP-N-acetylglucosamine 2-epimerase